MYLNETGRPVIGNGFVHILAYGILTGSALNRKKSSTMRKDELYTPDGWIDAARLLDAPEPFVIALGGRGIGKTYGILKELYQRGTPFIYMRRTQTQLDAVAVPALNPFNQISADLNEPIFSAKVSKHTVGFYKGSRNEAGDIVQDAEPFGIGIALSTFAAIRSLSAEKYEVLFFDEIIPERHEKPIKEEGLAFANVLESLNRNRELAGSRPLKIILASNSNTLNSKLLETLGVLNTVDKMNRSNKYYESIRGLVAIYRYIDSPISERKRGSVLYQVIQNRDFQGMSINNEMAASDYENVATRPIHEYRPLCSYDGVTVMRHKSKNEYYVVEGEKAADKYDALPLSRKAFNRKYYYVWGAIMDRRVFYQTATVKIKIEGAFK